MSNSIESMVVCESYMGVGGRVVLCRARLLTSWQYLHICISQKNKQIAFKESF